MELYLVEDERGRSWSPFAETRPVGELRFGASNPMSWGTPRYPEHRSPHQRSTRSQSNDAPKRSSPT
ncbi:MAG: hypothetical protein P8188_19315, partial [Gemmatimonadota bacterium]